MAGAVALASLGVVAAFPSVLVVDPLYAIVEAEWTLFGELVDGYVIQPGFGLVVAGYVWWCDDYNPIDRIQAPSVEGAA